MVSSLPLTCPASMAKNQGGQCEACPGNHAAVGGQCVDCNHAILSGQCACPGRQLTNGICKRPEDDKDDDKDDGGDDDDDHDQAGQTHASVRAGRAGRFYRTLDVLDGQLAGRALSARAGAEIHYKLGAVYEQLASASGDAGSAAPRPPAPRDPACVRRADAAQRTRRG